MLGVVKCRLCSANCSLISLFNGKCRKNRDYIRKLVEVTTGIKFQQNDSFKCICYTCIIQVYNFYIFKARSLENETILKSCDNDEKQKHSNKMEILDVDDIAIPDINELKDTLVPWLLSKQDDCEMLSSDNGTGNYRNKVKSCDASTQYDRVKNCNVSVQCNLTKDMISKSTQNEAFTCRSNKYTQSSVSSLQMGTQTNGILTKSCKIQCRMKENIQIKDSYTQMELITVDKSVQYCNECKENFSIVDCKCDVTNLVKMKKELETNCINDSLCADTNNISPNVTVSSPPLLSVRSRSHNVIICRFCDQALYSKEEYKTHKKCHMMCKFCKKKFSSFVRTKLHVENECTVKNSMTPHLVVQMVRIEHLKGLQKTYNKCLDDFNKSEREKRLPRMRIRSRSLSNVDSFKVRATCTLCQCSFTVLQGLKVGVDKCVQTFSNQTVEDCVVWSSNFAHEGDVVVPPAKRMKLSACIA